MSLKQEPKTFIVKAAGETARKAFYAARRAMREEHGGRTVGTGTLADKELFHQVNVPEEKASDVDAFIQSLLDDGKFAGAGVMDPVGMIEAGEGEFLFFGTSEAFDAPAEETPVVTPLQDVEKNSPADAKPGELKPAAKKGGGKKKKPAGASTKKALQDA